MSQTDSAAARSPAAAAPGLAPEQADADTAALAKGGRTNFLGFIMRLVARLPFLYFAGRWYGPEAVGRFAFAVWSRPDDNPWVTTLRDVIAEFVELPPQVPDAPGPFRYGRVDTLLELLRDARFSDVSVGEWRGQFAIGGGLPAPQAADFALAAFSVAEPLTKANEAIRERARRALTERFSSHLHDGVVRLNAAVHVVTGERK